LLFPTTEVTVRWLLRLQVTGYRLQSLFYIIVLCRISNTCIKFAYFWCINVLMYFVFEIQLWYCIILYLHLKCLLLYILHTTSLDFYSQHPCLWQSFLPRNAMCRRGICCRRVSVGLTCLCIVFRRLRCRQTSFSAQEPHQSNLLSASAGTQIQGDPSALQRRKIHGEFCDVRLKSPYISETVLDRLMVAMKH